MFTKIKYNFYRWLWRTSTRIRSFAAKKANKTFYILLQEEGG